MRRSILSIIQVIAVITVGLFGSMQAMAQCDNAGNIFPAGTFTPPTGSWGAAATNNWAGEVIQVNVILGDNYEFSTCGNFGGVNATYDTQLTLRDAASGGTVLAYNDDAATCGVQSYIAWTASYTGVAYVHLSQFNCVTNTNSTTVNMQHTPAPSCADFVVTAPVTGQTGNTTGAGDDCALDAGEEHTYEVTIPYASDWTFSLCGSTYDTYMSLGSSTCCDTDIASNDDFCGLQSEFTVTNLAAGTYYLNVEGFSTSTGSYTLDITAPAPTCHDFSFTAPFSDAGTTSGAANDCNIRASEEIIYEVVIPSTGDWVFSLCGSSYDTYLGISSSCCPASFDVAGNDDACGLQSEISTTALAAGTYYVNVEGFGSGSAGAYTLNVYQTGDNCNDPFVIASCPANIAGTTQGFADDYDETCPFNAPGSEDVVYSYTPTQNETLDISICNDAGATGGSATYDSKLYVYEGTCPDAGSPVACSDDGAGCTGFSSLITGLSVTGGTTYYIVVDGYGGSDGDFVLDLVCTACDAPTALAAGCVEETQAVLTWTDNTAGSATYTVKWGDIGFDPTLTGTSVAGTLTGVTLTGLPNDSTMDWYLEADCGASGTSGWISGGSISTLCGAVTAPFFEGFEAASTTRDCWRNEYVANTNDWFFSNGNGGGISSAFEGTENARHTSTNGGPYTTKFVTPMIDITGLATPTLSYAYGVENWFGDLNNLVVYERTGPCDAWSLLFDHSGEDLNVWQENEVTGLTSSATYQVGFEAEDNWGRAIVIDAVEVADPPPCLDPADLTCTVISDTEIEVSWTNGQDATNYNITCAACPGTPYTGTTSNDGSGVTTVSISGLTAATAYSFDLYEDCTGAAGTSGTFNCSSTTLCAPVAAPFTEDFEAASTTLPCWTQEYEGGTQDWIFTNGALGGAISTAYQGAQNAAFTSSNAPDDSTWLVSPMLNTTTLTTARLVFAHAQEEWAGDQSKLRVAYRTGPAAAWNQVASYSGDIPAWTVDNVVLPAGAIGGTVQVGFLGVDEWGRRPVIDSVVVEEAPPCLDPTVFTATADSDTEITLTWTNGQDDTDYNIDCATCPATPYTGTTSNDGSGTTSVTISGLTAETLYAFTMYEDCAASGGVGVSGSVNASATTLCTPDVAPYYQTFDALGTPNCWATTATGGGPWSIGNNTWFNDVTCSAATDRTGNGGYFAGIDMSGGDVGVIMEMNAVNVSALATPILEFYHWMCTTGYTPGNEIHVEYWDGSAWNLATTINTGSASWTRNEVDASVHIYNTNLVKYRFRGESGGSGLDFYGDLGIDDIAIIDPPACPDPTNISVSAQTTTSFDISFDPGTVGSTAAVEYGAPGFAVGSGTTVTQVTVAGTNTISVTGLPGGTLYDYYVSENCGGGDLSNDIGPGTTYTLGNPTACGINVSIPDNACGTDSARVEIPVTLTETQMGFDTELKEVHVIIEHTWSGDLDIWLESPDGTMVELSTDNGGSANNYGTPNSDCTNPTEFTMTAATSVTASSAPFPGPHVPEGDLGDFSGPAGGPYPDPNGTWTLFVCDGAGGDLGEVEFVELIFGPPPGCPNDPYNAAVSNFTDSSIDWTFDTDNDGTGAATTYFVEYGPVGFTQGTGTVISGSHTGAPGTTISATLSGLAASSVYDFYFYENCGTLYNSNIVGPISGYTLGNPSACQLGLEVAHNVAGDSTFLELPVSGNPGEFLGVDKVVGEVKLLMEHTWDSDVEAFLRSPDGITVELTTDNGGTGDDYGDITDLTCGTPTSFRMDAAVAVTAGSSPFTAEAAYIPEGDFADFNGLTNTVDGTWTLIIHDDAAGDNGTLEFAEIVFELPPPCQDPSGLASTAVGSTTADFSWFSWNAGSTWSLEYGTPGYTAGTGTVGGTGTSVLGAGNTGQITGLSEGTAYEVYVVENCGGGDVSNYHGPVYIETIPENDECADAIPMNVQVQGYCSTYTLGSNVGATASGGANPGCSFYNGGDIWFSLVVPGSGDVTIETNYSTPVGLTDIGIAAYDACGGTEVGCDDDSGPGFMSELALTGLTPGNTIYVRVWEYGGNATGTFDICAFEPTDDAPINNFPCAAQNLVVGLGCSPAIYANLNATTSITGSCTNGVGDVWFRATVPTTGVLVVNVTDVAMGDGTMTAHSITDCNDSGTWTEIACSDDEGIGLMPYLYMDADEGIAPGDEVYIRVAGWSGANEGPFSICASQGIVWDGSTNDDYTVGSNWFHDGPAPVAGENVIFPGGTANDCSVNFDSEALNVWVMPNATLSVDAGDELAIGGNLVTNQPGFNMGPGTVVFNGTAAQEINSGIGQLTFEVLEVDNANGVTLNPNAGTGVIDITNALVLTDGNFDATAGDVTLVSDASGTAYLQDWSGAATTGSFVGNITVQRYVANPGYHHISASVNSPDIPSQLAEYNPFGANGVGVTPIDGAGAACSDTTLEQGSNYGSIFEWDEDHPNFTGSGCNLWGWVVRSSGSMQNARGYAAQSNNTGPFTFDMTGTVNASPQTYGGLGNTGGGNAFQLAGNPFAAPITWNAVAGFAPFSYAWDDGSGTYTAYAPGTVNYSINQGFFVLSTTGSSNFTLDNTYKFAGDPGFLRTSTVFGDYSLRIDVEGNGFSHFTVIGFADMLWGTSVCTNGWDDQCDAFALPGNSDQPFMYSMTTEGVMADPNRLQYNTQTLLNGGTRSVPVAFDPGANGSFTFSASDMESFPVGTSIILEDLALGVTQDLNANATYTFTAQADDYDANNPSNRFVIHFSPASVTDLEEVVQLDANFYLEAEQLVMGLTVMDVTEGTFMILNSMGQEVMNDGNIIVANGRYTKDVSGLAAGMYVVNFVTENKTFSGKFVKH